jgi:uncharacterized membrane protein (GlpM family)
MDWVLKALLTASSVLLVMLLARRGGREVAGMVAALPTVTAPALAWLAHDHGGAFAAKAAVASVAACAMLAAFAVAHAHVARHRGVAATLACGVLAAALLAGPAALASASLVGAFALAVFSCLLALRCLPTPPQGALLPARTPVIATALAATGVGMLAVATAPLFGSFASGLLVSLPLISGAVAASEHAAVGHAGVARLLRGYVAGLLARASYCAAFAWLVLPLGWIEACGVAALCACAVGLLVTRIPARGRRQAASAPKRPPFLHAQRT